MKEEIWKTIKDNDGHYFISNKGKMKREEYIFYDTAGRRQHRKEKIYSPIYNKKNGYYSYKYRNNYGSSKSEYAHRLVGKHFIVNPNLKNFNDINHKNGDKSVNEDWNLEWCDRKMNMEHASKNNLINKDSEKRKKQAPINSSKGIHKLFKSIVEYGENGDFIVIHDSYNKIIGSGGNKSTICCHRLSYKNHFFRDYEILIKQYNKIPLKIDISKIKNIKNNKRKKYLSIDENGKEMYYNKLEQLPISREELWFCFNHNIKDKQNKIWDILNI